MSDYVWFEEPLASQTKLNLEHAIQPDNQNSILKYLNFYQKFV